MPSEYKPPPNISLPPNISPQKVLTNLYKPRVYIRDFTVFAENLSSNEIRATNVFLLRYWMREGEYHYQKSCRDIMFQEFYTSGLYEIEPSKDEDYVTTHCDFQR